MVVKTLGPKKISRYRVNAAKKRLESIERQLVDELKNSLDTVLELEHLHELRDHIDGLIAEWEETIIELDDDDIDDLLDKD